MLVCFQHNLNYLSWSYFVFHYHIGPIYPAKILFGKWWIFCYQKCFIYVTKDNRYIYFKCSVCPSPSCILLHTHHHDFFFLDKLNTAALYFTCFCFNAALSWMWSHDQRPLRVKTPAPPSDILKSVTLLAQRGCNHVQTFASRGHNSEDLLYWEKCSHEHGGRWRTLSATKVTNWSPS